MKETAFKSRIGENLRIPVAAYQPVSPRVLPTTRRLNQLTNSLFKIKRPPSGLARLSEPRSSDQNVRLYYTWLSVQSSPISPIGGAGVRGRDTDNPENLLLTNHL